MRKMDMRLQKLEAATGNKPIAIIWWDMDKKSETELQAEIAEQEAKGFRVVVVRWLTEAEQIADIQRAVRRKEAIEPPGSSQIDFDLSMICTWRLFGDSRKCRYFKPGPAATILAQGAMCSS